MGQTGLSGYMIFADFCKVDGSKQQVNIERIILYCNFRGRWRLLVESPAFISASTKTQPQLLYQQVILKPVTTFAQPLCTHPPWLRIPMISSPPHDCDPISHWTRLQNHCVSHCAPRYSWMNHSTTWHMPPYLYCETAFSAVGEWSPYQCSWVSVYWRYYGNPKIIQ